MATLIMFVIPFAVACETKVFSGFRLDSISLNLDNVKTGYLINEEFTSDGLEVTGLFKKPNGETETHNVKEWCTVDSSEFNNGEAGKYTVNVNCTVDGISKSSSYTVSVLKEAREGLFVTHSDGSRIKTINIDAINPTATINPEDIIVKSVEYGQVKKEITDYSVKVYKEAEEITSYSGLGSGTYQIWVSKESSKVQGFLLEDFVLIYVVENVSDFKFVGGETTQNIGIDTITQTWMYQITHSTSTTPVTLTADDVTVSNFDVLTAGTKKHALVTYVYYKANGEKVELTVEVEYNVIKGENQTVETRSYRYSEIPVHNDNTQLTQEDFVGKNSFLTKIPSGIVNYRDSKTDDGIIQIRGDAFRVTFKGVGTLKISARSTGNANLSSVGVKDSDGNYLKGAFTSSNVQELDYIEGHMYQVTGGYSLITFTISKPGEYIIFTNDNNPEGDAIYNRETRVNNITLNDVYDKTSATSISYDDTAVRSVGNISKANIYYSGSED